MRPGAATGRAPHINFLLLYSGLMRQLQTVMFFERRGRSGAARGGAVRRARLMAQREQQTAFRFDIRLRGGDETPFFDD